MGEFGDQPEIGSTIRGHIGNIMVTPDISGTQLGCEPCCSLGRLREKSEKINGKCLFLFSNWSELGLNVEISLN